MALLISGTRLGQVWLPPLPFHVTLAAQAWLAPVAGGRVCERAKRVPRRSLVPKAPAQLPPRQGPAF